MIAAVHTSVVFVVTLFLALASGLASGLDPNYGLDFGWPEYITPLSSNSVTPIEPEDVTVAASGNTVIALYANRTDGSVYSVMGTALPGRVSFELAVTDNSLGSQPAVALSAPSNRPLDTLLSASTTAQQPLRDASHRLSATAPLLPLTAYRLLVLRGTVYLDIGSVWPNATEVVWERSRRSAVASGNASRPAIASWGSHVIVSWIDGDGAAQYQSMCDSGSGPLSVHVSGSLGPALRVSMAVNGEMVVLAIVDPLGRPHYRFIHVDRSDGACQQLRLHTRLSSVIFTPAAVSSISVALLKGNHSQVAVFMYIPAGLVSSTWRAQTAVAAVQRTARVWNVTWLTPFTGAALGPACQSASLAVTDGNVPVLCVADVAPFTGALGCSASLFMDRARWMQALMEAGRWDAAQTLRGVTMPGSHDSGTYVNTDHAGRQYVQTQGLDIYGQLNLGVRYFDIRPMYQLASHAYWTQHGGVRGALMADVFDSIRNFLVRDQRKELVIIKLSHYGQGFLDPPTDVQRMLAEVVPADVVTHMVTVEQLAGRRLADVPLQELLRTSGRLAVVADSALPPDRAMRYLLTYSDCSPYAPPTACSASQPAGDLSVFDNYAEMADAAAVVADQAAKFDAFGGVSSQVMPNGTCLSSQCDLFLLAWQATQDGPAIVQGVSVRTLAARLNSRLALALSSPPFAHSQLPPTSTQATKRVNIIYVDFVEGARAADLAIWSMFGQPSSVPSI